MNNYKLSFIRKLAIKQGLYCQQFYDTLYIGSQFDSWTVEQKVNTREGKVFFVIKHKNKSKCKKSDRLYHKQRKSHDPYYVIQTIVEHDFSQYKIKPNKNIARLPRIFKTLDRIDKKKSRKMNIRDNSNNNKSHKKAS